MSTEKHSVDKEHVEGVVGRGDGGQGGGHEGNDGGLHGEDVVVSGEMRRVVMFRGVK